MQRTVFITLLICLPAYAFSQNEPSDFVEQFFETIKVALEDGSSVKLSGFGNFGLRDKPARPGRNRKTGEEIPISARRVVTFKASQKLKEAIDKNSAALKGLFS